MSNYSEADLFRPALRIMAKRSENFIRMTELISELKKHLKPSAPDTDKSPHSGHDKFSCKIERLKNHPPLTERGLAVYDKDRQGFLITRKGRDYIQGSL